MAISTSARTIAERVMRLVGRPDLIDDPWFATGEGRVAHADELDEIVGGWIAQRPFGEVMDAFTEAEAAVAPIYDISDVVNDPQYRALGSFARVPDPELGDVLIPNVLFRMDGTPGRIRWAAGRSAPTTPRFTGKSGSAKPSSPNSGGKECYESPAATAAVVALRGRQPAAPPGQGIRRGRRRGDHRPRGRRAGQPRSTKPGGCARP